MRNVGYSGYQTATIKAFFGAAAYGNLPNGIPAIEVSNSELQVPVSTTMYQSYFSLGPIPTYAPVEGTSVSEAAGWGMAMSWSTWKQG